MSTARVLLFEKKMDPEGWDAFIARVAGRLSALEQQGDVASWEKAQIIIDADHEAEERPEMQGKNPWQIRHRVSQDLRHYWADQQVQHPTPSFLANARKLYQTWPELFMVNHKNSSFDSYKRIANSSLPKVDKEKVKAWLEEVKPTQAMLRQEIRTRVDALLGVYRPDFDLKVSNHWVFQVEKRTDGFDGGVNYDLFANLLHFYSAPGDTVLDPFAGGGILAETLRRYRHFREVTQAHQSGPRTALMSDIAPVRSDIVQADARDGLPWSDQCAQLAVLDPPYWSMSAGKYAGLGDDIATWMASLLAVTRHVARCLTPDGIMAVMTDDFVRKDRHEPVALRVLGVLLGDGWEPVATIYNFNRNFIAMSPLEMARAKAACLLVNAVKIIHVVRKPVQE